MASPPHLLSPLPLPDNAAPWNADPLIIPADVIKLQNDTINVVEGRVPIHSFPPDYQEKIKAYYRFTPFLHQTSKQHNAVTLSNDTLDAV